MEEREKFIMGRTKERTGKGILRKKEGEEGTKGRNKEKRE
jgi:hypothetical protein